MKALLAGTFDPPSLGHLDLIERASRLCSELTVGIGINPAKQPIFTPEERKEMLQTLTKSFSHVKIVSFTGLVVDYAKHHQIHFLIRGLRSFADLDRELQLAAMNKHLSGIETVLLPANPLYAHISSSLIQELGFNKAHLTKLIPSAIEKKVFAKF